jgi:uncharacterized protein (PEP-CTERM system associated)
MYTDNVLDSATNRRWDLVTIVTPGISIVGDAPNAQVKLSYAPELRDNARTPSENGITQQLIGSGLFTVIPDTFYVDARAVSGEAPTLSGFGALGPGLSLQQSAASGGIGTIGLSKQNRTQSTSLSISPYLLHRFGDFGTGKIGYELNQSSFSNGGGVVPQFFTSGGSGQHSTTNQAVAQFETGEEFAPYRDLVLASASQGTGTGVNHNSSQKSLTNRLGYLVNREVTVFGELGYESLRFGGIPPTRIDDMVWGIGTTLTPNPDSSITVSYGHKNGVNSIEFDGSYAITARTRISARYSTGLQSDLQGIQSQLDLADLDSTGQVVDSQTGAPLFIGNSALGVQSGLFRTKALTLTASTILDRDQINVSILFSQQTTVALGPPVPVTNPLFIPPPPVGQSSQAKTGILTWVHQFSEALTMNSSVSYSTSQTSGAGTQQSLAASVSMQYLLSETLAANVRYSYFDRMSATPGQGIFQNLVIVGLTKQF